MSGRLNFEYGFNTHTAHPRDKKTPMRVYFLSDFVGAKTGTEQAFPDAIIKIDIDNFDDVMTKLSPSIILASGAKLTFNELEDFHPDTLFDHLLFKNLRRLKRELNNSSTAEQAAQEILSLYQFSPDKSSPVTHEDSSSNLKMTIDNEQQADDIIEENDAMFERLLGQKQSPPVSTAITSSISPNIQTVGNLDRFLSDLLSPHIIKDSKPEHKDLMIFIDTAIAELMKSILHLDPFQTLESTWRSVRDVIFNEEYDDENQHFYLVNTDKNALMDAVAGDTHFISRLSQHIKNTDIEYYDVLVGNYEFSAANEDVTTLNYIASIAETLKCQFVSAAGQSLTNASTDSLWQQFRQTPQANHVALCYPRVLLRMPYGQKHDEIDAFSFEELGQTHQHKQLLWGNSAFSCARLLIRQYHCQINGQGNHDNSITELPAFVYIDGDEKKLHPCGEILLSESQLNTINSQGIMGFVSFRNKNCIRLFGDDIRAANI
jgi:type VI secretion system protein ImpC